MASFDNRDFNLDKQNELDRIYVSKICQILGLDEDREDFRSIAKHLLTDGCQTLEHYCTRISSSIFQEQMSNDECSPLLQVLQDYFEQQWQNIPFDWFKNFLTEQKNNEDNNVEYQRVLKRTAQYGSKFTKECSVFSIVLQLVFEFDDETIIDGDFFDSLWKSFIMNGLKLALAIASQHIVPEVKDRHMNDLRSPLLLALRECFREPLMILFRQCKIDARKNLLEKALDCLAADGWKLGLQNPKVEQLIKPDRYSLLIQTVEKYLDEQCLNKYADSGPSPLSTSPHEFYIPGNIVYQSSTPKLIITQHPSQLINSSLESTRSFQPIRSPAQSTSGFNDSYKSDIVQSSASISTTILECDAASECAKREEKFSLSTFMQAGEFDYIQKSWNDVSQKIVKDFSKSKNFSKFIQDCLLPVIYLLKRHQNLNAFFENLSFHYSSMIDLPIDNSIKISMRLIIHVLLLSSDSSVSQMIMALLCKRNPVPFLQPSINNDHLYSFVPEIIYTWDCRLPTLLSFGIGPCQGKSELLNTLFMCSFGQTVESIYFQQTIDIDFGYNFVPRRSINIADTHGQMTKQLLHMIQHLFEGFIIQINGTFFNNNMDFIQDILEIIPNNKFSIIIIRDVNRHLHSRYPEFLQLKYESYVYEIPITTLPDVSAKENNQNKIFIKLLRDRIFPHLPTKCTYERDYLQNEIQRLTEPNNNSHLKQTVNMIEILKNELKETITDINILIEYFPVYTKFVKLCSQRQEIAKHNFYGSTNEEIYILRQKIYNLEKDISNIASIQTGIIFNQFLNILQSNETMTIIHTLANDLQNERNELISKYSMDDQLTAEKYLSLEVLWRNAIVCYPYQQDDSKQIIHNKYAEYLKAGYPFEIIDGDNFNFPFSFLHETLRDFRDKKILVISIIGPQNTGKSTLLNYMFGTLFDVRNGRCTRGIYGSFVKSNFSNFDYVFLIDTEGLMSVEKGEKEFDRRLVLFCLAVSHVVIINMIGEINDVLKDMLTLCADTLQQIGVSKVPQPKIHFILNQRVDLNIENNRIAIDKIQMDINKLGLDQIIDISKENFHTLPSAFRAERTGNDARLPYAILTEENFLDHVQNLCGTIIRSGTEPFCRSQEYFCDPIQWLDFASIIFDTLQKFSDLTYFHDVNERRHDSEAREYIKTKLCEIFTPEYKAQLIEETTNYTEDGIYDELHAKELKITDDLQQDVENELKMSKASNTIRDRSQQFLKAQITAMFAALRSSAVMTSERKKIVRLIHDGQGELKRLVEDTIANGMLTTEIAAKQKFESMFDDIILAVHNKFIPFNFLNQAFNFIYTNYHIYENDCLPDRQILISEQFYCLIELNKRSVSIDDDIKNIQNLCLSYLYEQSSYVEEQSFDPDISNPYSIQVIDNLVYLNKDNLRAHFDKYCNHQKNEFEKSFKLTENNHTNFHNRDTFRKVIDVVGNQIGFGKTHTDSNIPTYHFQKHIRQLIKEQRVVITNPNYIVDDEIILQMSISVQRLTTDIINIIKDRIIDTEIIKFIIGSLHNIIRDINLELDPFKLILSRRIKAVLHSYVVLLLTKFYYNEQELHFQQTFKKLTDGKQEMCNYFVSMVVPNVSYDNNSAVNLVKQLKECIQRHLIIDAQEIINIEIGKISYVNRQWVQERCDGMLNAVNNTWLHDYIRSPIKVIENYFISMWKTTHDQINRLLIDRKNYYIEIVNDFFRCIKWMLSAIQREGAPATFVDSIFQSDAKVTLLVNENLKNKKRCMAIILYAYLLGKTIPNTISVYESTYKLTPDGYDVFDKLAKHSPPSPQLIALTQEMSQSYDNLSIGNLTALLQALFSEHDQIIQYFRELPTDFGTLDKVNMYKGLLDKVRGCPETCPCCHRPCDVDHTVVQSIPGSSDNQHCCTLGHALRAMNGFRYEITDEASLVMCEHIDDNQVIVVGFARKRWLEFKKDHSDWNFDPIMTVDQLNRLHGKFLGVWARIGPELCEKYGMKFVTTNIIRPTTQLSFHYILLLDGSGSMKGQPWRDLLNSVKEFLKCRLQRNSNDLISILVFSARTHIVYFNETINNIDVSRIRFPGGSTNFTSAFATVYNVVKRAQAQTLNIAFHTIDNVQVGYAIIFMSDGQSPCPQKELDALWADYKPVIKRFWTVALGQRQIDNLKKINATMNGFFLSIKDSSDLLETYAEIARTNIS